MNPLIKADNISVVIGEQNILQNVTLEVKSQDFITIIGPNGAGKSMLLKCLMGLSGLTSGSILAKDNLKIGYVPQKLVTDHIIPITARRFIELRKDFATDELDNIVKEVGIEKILHKPIYSLSGGELQRVLLARAMLGNPELLILDEPAQNLDISGQLAFYKLLDKIYNERDIAILMVSHDLHMVMSSTKQVVCLYHHICCSGEPQMVTKDPEFISLFGDDMARMMAVYNHDHDHVHGG